MTVQVQTIVNSYTSAGGSTFVYSFQILNSSHLVVSVNGIIKTLGSDYAVTGVGVQAGGTITGLATSNGDKVLLYRNVPLSRTIDYQTNGDFRATTVNPDFDLLWMMAQQLDERSNRALTLAVGSTASVALPSPIANYYLGWDSLGAAIINIAGMASAAVSAAMQPIVNAATLAAARIGLGAAALGANSDITSLTGLTSGVRQIRQIQPISASVAANALTISASALSLEFRDATGGLTNSGAVSFVQGTPANLVISSGSTLGAVNATQARIVVLALNNAGTLELAAVNISGGNDLSETGLISTTAEGGAGAADSASVIYSTTARSNVAYRVLGYVEFTQAVAGTYATAPSTIQGMGGEALAAMSSLGYSQTVQNVTGSRALGTTYYNTTGKPIAVAVTSFVNNVGNSANLTINGQTYGGGSAYTASATSNVFGIVPPGGSYSSNVSAGGALSTWHETR